MSVASGMQFGPYRIVEKIGAGGMGEIYRATDTRLDRDVALKLVSETFLLTDGPASGSASPPSGTSSRSSASRDRFLREARASATLNHPNICAIHDVGEQDSRPFLVMELLHGETLKSYMQGKPLGREEVLSFSRQIARALSAAHKRGIVHRDIKPANLFVVHTEGQRNHLKVLDFGLAKNTNIQPETDDATLAAGPDATATVAALELTRPGAAMGTVAYMSPEQARGEALDARSDLFSLGSVIFEMATGKSPFAGASAADVFAALLMKEPPPVSSINPNMAAALDPIVQKLLSKDPQARYASADELTVDLEQLRPEASLSSSVHRMNPAVAPAPAPASKPKTTWLIPAVAAVLLVAAGAGLWLWKHSREGAASAPAAVTKVPAPADKDAIIVSDFVNQTGDPVFDTTLNGALGIALEQSPVLSIVSQRHLQQSMQFLGKASTDKVTPDIAREIAEREGIKAILTGSVSNIGNSYVLTLHAVNTATGEDIASTSANAAGKDQVLNTLNEAATAMRSKLGESLSSIQRLNAPFGQATTPSLEAFRAYALGDAAHQAGRDIPEARDHYQRALELDPNLAMASARLGVIALNSGARDEADRDFTRAYANIKNVSERERLYISAHYFENVTGEMNKAIETLELATQEYPRQADLRVNLSVAYLRDGQVERSRKTIEEVLALNAPYAISIEDGIYAAMEMDDYARVHELQKMSEERNLSGTNLLAANIAVDQQQQRPDAARKQFEELQGRPDGFLASATYASGLIQDGQVKLGQQEWNRGIEKAIAVGAPDSAASGLLGMAAELSQFGRCGDFAASQARAASLSQGKETQAASMILTAACGQPASAQTEMAELQKHYPLDTLIHEYDIPIAKALLALRANQPQQAIDALEIARAHDDLGPSRYLRALAYLQLKQPQPAIHEMQASTRFVGMDFRGGSCYALDMLTLGRAYAMAGDKADAKKAYDVFFNRWKNADPDLPQIAEAKKEYASL